MADFVDGNVPEIIPAAVTEPPITPIFRFVEVNSSVPREKTVRQDVAGSIERRTVSVISRFKAEADVRFFGRIHPREAKRTDARPDLKCGIATLHLGREIGRPVIDLITKIVGLPGTTVEAECERIVSF
jgi:hypothetical protein